ncbi:hypothetical protein [Pseudobutyrivibrio sp. MD2005]|uniref:hypothetical protein n=1 Tax=Pseudobutyrivibrio sp. MD2005 TaxID=1410616 RepID=UPI00048987B2|nr:hypothetical protein [Pseudobutyrivibrio sp. MD2005]
MKRRLDKDMIVSLAVISQLVTICIIFVILFILNIQISHNNLASIIGSYSGVSGIVWLILLCRNC